MYFLMVLNIKHKKIILKFKFYFNMIIGFKVDPLNLFIPKLG